MRAVPAALFLLLLASALPLLASFLAEDAFAHPYGRCRPWITGSLHYDVRDADGNPRSNPNDTLYPGDAVRYEFSYGWSGNCYRERTYPVTDSGAISVYGSHGSHGSRGGNAEALIARTNDCHGGGSRGAAGYGGDDSWDRDSAKTGCGDIKYKISGKEKHRHRCGDGYCTFYITRWAHDTLHPATVAPVVEVQMYEHIIRDPYGYMAANGDHTNYVWDPIAIEHAADFTYKNQREGTITFDYSRAFSPLVEEGGYECDRRCVRSLAVAAGSPLDATGIGFLPYQHASENGGGMYAYASPGLDVMGNREIRYDVRVLNEGRLINTHHNQTVQLIVSYDPVFDKYEYPVLADGRKYAYDDRQGLVMLYSGSVGSGPDDDGLLHGDRRSRINAFYPNTTMHSLFDGIPDVAIDPDLLEWDSIDHVRGTDPDGWLSLDAGHAMFEDEGYGILRFSQEISGIVHRDSNNLNFRHNATTHNVIASDRWAGHDSYANFNYTYQYPHTPFAAWYNVTAFDASGAADDGVTPITVSATVANLTHAGSVPQHIPAGQGRVTVMLDAYVHDKALHDTGDEAFAAAVLDETYDMENGAGGTGDVSMWLKKTGLSLDENYIPGNDILGQPRYLLLGLESEMDTVIEIPGREISRILHTEFDVDYVEEMTVSEIPLSMSRSVSDGLRTQLVSVSVPEWFGYISSIEMNGESVDFGTDCVYECVFTDIDGGNVTVYNVWGGTAVGTLNASDILVHATPEVVFEESHDLIWYVVAVGIMGFVAYSALRHFWKRTLVSSSQ